MRRVFASYYIYTNVDKTVYSGCLKLLEILDVCWNLKQLLEISWNIILFLLVSFG